MSKGEERRPSINGSWDEVYRSARPESLPWFAETIDADVDAALEREGVTPAGGPVLDLGTGPGTVAITFAKRGFHVTALDLAEGAIKMARKRAGRLATKIQWIATDLFAAEFPGWFQLVLDRGVYHTLEPPARVRYAEHVPRWLRRGGLLVLKCFSSDEPGDWGPNRIARRELEEAFEGPLERLSLEPSSFPGTLDHAPRAWLAVYRLR